MKSRSRTLINVSKTSFAANVSGQPASAGVAILRHGIEFDAIGGEVVHIVALLGRTEETSKRQMELLAALSRLLQTDNLQTYALLFVLGVLVLLYLTLT